MDWPAVLMCSNLRSFFRAVVNPYDHYVHLSAGREQARLRGDDGVKRGIPGLGVRKLGIAEQIRRIYN